MNRDKSWQRTAGQLSRRQTILAGLGLGGTAMLGGCIGDDDAGVGDDEVDLDDLDDVHVEGQQLRYPIPQNPEEMHFIWEVGNFVEGTELESARMEVYPATHTTPIWARWLGPYAAELDGEMYPQLYDSVEVDPFQVRVEISDDAYWSDGQPVRAKDAVGSRALWVAPDDEHGYEIPPGEGHIVGAAARFDMPDGPDGKVYEFYPPDTQEWEDANGFYWDAEGILFWIGWPYPRLGPMVPSHSPIFEDLIDYAIDAWEDRDPDKMDRIEMAQEMLTEDDLRASRDPDNFVSHGAWTLDALHGTQEVVLTPNEHHPASERINFDEVVLEFSDEPSRQHAALQSGHLDQASVETPAETADAFPDHVEEVTTPAGGGYVVALNHDSHWRDVRVRQAAMYAMHTPDVADNIHPTATEAIVTPGFDSWAFDQWADEDWAEENLISYEQDLDRAEELMEEAGYERNAEDVWEKDGEPVEMTFATASETPRMEQTISSQLGEFGMEIDVQTFDAATYVERWTGTESNEYFEEDQGRGDFPMWAGDWASGMPAGFFSGLETFWWTSQARTMQLRSRNYFPHDVQETAAEQYEDGGTVSGQYDLWQDFTIDIPPLGDPEGEPEPFNIVWTAARVNNGPLSAEDPQNDNEYYNPPHDEAHPENAEYYWRKLAWGINYWLPVLPVALNMEQHFFNRANWIWPDQTDDEENQAMWEYLGLNWDTNNLTGMGRVLANPDNPKDGAEVADD